jgi:hypothetical protein
MVRRGNGEGTITRRKDGRWEAKYTAHTAEGPKRRALYGRTRKEVADKLAKALTDCASGYTFDTANMTVGEYLDRWLNDSDRGSVRTSTYERHEQIVRLHLKPAFGRVKLSKLTPAHVQGLYRHKLDSGLSPATVQKIHVVGPSQGSRAGAQVEPDPAQRRRCGQGTTLRSRRDASAFTG